MGIGSSELVLLLVIAGLALVPLAGIAVVIALVILRERRQEPPP